MKQEKRICFRITPRRIAGAIVIATMLVNLIIVGAVAAFDPPPSTITMTPSLPTFMETATLTPPPGPTDAPASTLTFTPTQTSTETPSATPTNTITPTSTLTQTPSVVPCIPQSSWPVYIVQPGDTLFSVAPAVGSTVSELKLANCLSSDLIYTGQPLYVPRVPIDTPTFTPTTTSTSTTPPDTPTDFQNPNMFCRPPGAAFLSVLPYDPQGVRSVTALLMSVEGNLLDQISMLPDGATYYGSNISRAYTVFDIDSYYFSAVDNLGNNTVSNAYHPDPSSNCFPPSPTPNPTPGPIPTQAGSVG